MRTIIWFLYFWLYLLCLAPMNLYVRSLIKKGKKAEVAPMVDRVVQNWARRLLAAAGVKITVEGMENIPEEACLYVSNHQGNFDIPAMLCSLGPLKSIVAKIELAKMPGIYSWMTYFDCPFIDRGDPRQSLKCLTEAQHLLESGRSVIIFPEGTRSKGPAMGEFKAGSLRCALKAEAPIVPVVIDGTYLAMEAHGFWIHPADVRITILPAVATKGIEKERTKGISSEIQELIQRGVETSMKRR